MQREGLSEDTRDKISRGLPVQPIKIEDRCSQIVEVLKEGCKNNDEYLRRVLDELWSISRSRDDIFLAELISQACRHQVSSQNNPKIHESESDESSSEEDSFDNYQREYKAKQRAKELDATNFTLFEYKGLKPSLENQDKNLNELINMIEMVYLQQQISEPNILPQKEISKEIPPKASLNQSQAEFKSSKVLPQNANVAPPKNS